MDSLSFPAFWAFLSHEWSPNSISLFLLNFFMLLAFYPYYYYYHFLKAENICSSSNEEAENESKRIF